MEYIHSVEAYLSSTDIHMVIVRKFSPFTVHLKIRETNCVSVEGFMLGSIINWKEILSIRKNV
jgi:hypothetical protein